MTQINTSKLNHPIHLLSIIIALTLMCGITLANTPKTLSMEEAVVLAVRQNPNVISAQLDTALSKYDLAVAKNGYSLHYGLTGNIDYQRLNFMGTTQSSSYYQVSPQMQWLSAYGTNVTLGVANSWNDSRPYVQGTLEVKQPLLAGFSRAVVMEPLRVAEDDVDSKRIQEKQTLIDTITKTILLYRQILMDKNNTIVQEQSLAEVKKDIWATNEKIKVGELEETASLQLRLQQQSIELSLERARNQFIEHIRQLQLSLGMELGKITDIENNIKFKLETLDTKSQILNAALEKDPQYQLAKIAVAQAKRQIEIAHNAQLPDVDLIAKGAVGKSPSLDDEQAFSQLWNINNNNADIRLQASMPIDDMIRKRKIFASQQQLQRANLQLNVIRESLVNSVDTLMQTIDSQIKQLHVAESELALASQVYQLEVKKQQVGRSTSLSVTLSQNNYIRAKLNVIQNQLDYLNSITQLDALTGHTLQTWNIALVE